MVVIIRLEDTAQALGLKCLLKEYFDRDAVIVNDFSDSDMTDNPDALFIVSPGVFYENVEILFTKRQRTVIASCGGGARLDLSLGESQLVEQLNTIIQEHESRTTDHSSDLSPRENEVLRLVAMGYMNKEIADKLGISINTVLSHRKNISYKLGIKSVSGLSVYAIMNGYISENDISI